MGFRWTPERVGAALCLAAAASFALQPLLVKLAFDSGASVVSVGALRFALAAAVLGLSRGVHSPSLPCASCCRRSFSA